MAKKAICLISGGLDSCVTSFIAKEKGYEIYALSFRYGQIHKKELSCAKKVAEAVQAKKHIILDIDFNTIARSSLLNKSNDAIANHDVNEIGKTIPSTYVPARNTIFLSFALALAESMQADTIFLGVNAVDFSGYPDCRPEYIKAYEHMANLATKRGVEGHFISIESPLMYQTKSEIVKTGMILNAPFEKTWSCYRGKEKACGRCDSCILRLKGFHDAGYKDPLPYGSYPEWYKNKR
jgi:7-cyano-7-deazaguanine synthase